MHNRNCYGIAGIVTITDHSQDTSVACMTRYSSIEQIMLLHYST